MTTNNNQILCEIIECPICMLEIEGINNRVTTECGHQFHTKCLLSNVAFNGFGCPYCRNEMVEESIAKNAHEDDEEDEDDDDDETISDESDTDDEEAMQEEDVLRGFRFLMQRITGEILLLHSDHEEEDLYEAEIARSETPRPTINLIVKKLSDKGITMETLVKALFLDHPEFNRDDDVDDYHKINDDIYEQMREIIMNYNPEQEEELEPQVDQTIQEMVQQLVTVPSQNIQDKLDFYFLDNSHIENCKTYADNLYFEENEFINSILTAVF